MKTVFLQWREMTIFLKVMFICMNPSCKVSSIQCPLSTVCSNGKTCLHARVCAPWIASVLFLKLYILHNCGHISEGLEGMMCVEPLDFLQTYCDDINNVSVYPQVLIIKSSNHVCTSSAMGSVSLFASSVSIFHWSRSTDSFEDITSIYNKYFHDLCTHTI
jgi:hypothetical protein